MRILFTNHLALGSASSYRQAGFAKNLQNRGHESWFIGRLPKHNPPNGVGPEWNVFNFIRYWKEPLIIKALSNLRLFMKCSENSSLVHVNRANPYTATIVSAAGKGRRVVVDMEDWDGFGGYSSYAGRYGLRGCLLTSYELAFPRRADAVLVVSRFLYRRMIQLGVPKSRLFWVPNGYDEDIFHPDVPGERARQQYGLCDSPVVIYAGTFWKFEANLHKIALATFEKIVEEIPEVRLLLVGTGNLSLKKAISGSSLRNRVIAPGFVPRSQVPSLISAADVAMHVISGHPFHQASSPMIIPEYMAMGKAIVAPKVGELPAILGDDCGLLVDRPDAHLLAAGVVEVLRDEHLRNAIGWAAARRARERYSYKVLTKSLEAAYRQAMA